MMAKQDIQEAIDMLWTEDPKRSAAFGPILSGFKEGTISPDVARSVTEALLRVAMYDGMGYSHVRVPVQEILTLALAPDQNKDLAIAITETLIAIPKENDLIDYEESILVIKKLFEADDIHPAIPLTIKNSVSSVHKEATDSVVIRSLERYLDSRQLTEISEEIYSILMAMIAEGSDYACSEGIKILTNMSNNSGSVPLRLVVSAIVCNQKSTTV